MRYLLKVLFESVVLALFVGIALAVVLETNLVAGLMERFAP